MFIRKTTHDRLIDEAIANERAACKVVWAGEIGGLQTTITGLKTRLSAEEGISASLRDEITDMKPLFELGSRAQAQRDKDAAAKKAKRAAAASVPAVKSKRAAK